MHRDVKHLMSNIIALNSILFTMNKLITATNLLTIYLSNIFVDHIIVEK